MEWNEYNAQNKCINICCIHICCYCCCCWLKSAVWVCMTEYCGFTIIFMLLPLPLIFVLRVLLFSFLLKLFNISFFLFSVYFFVTIAGNDWRFFPLWNAIHAIHVVVVYTVCVCVYVFNFLVLIFLKVYFAKQNKKQNKKKNNKNTKIFNGTNCSSAEYFLVYVYECFYTHTHTHIYAHIFSCFN